MRTIGVSHITPRHDFSNYFHVEAKVHWIHSHRTNS